MKTYATVKTVEEAKRMNKVFENTELLYGVTITIHENNSVWIFTTLNYNRYILTMNKSFDEKFFETLRTKAIEECINHNKNSDTVITMYFND